MCSLFRGFTVISIKHQSRLQVLQKFYYSKRDISAILVEAVFKVITVALFLLQKRIISRHAQGG